jgi:hypothetical protein
MQAQVRESCALLRSSEFVSGLALARTFFATDQHDLITTMRLDEGRTDDHRID